MTKDEFYGLSDKKRRDLVLDALSNLIIFEELAPTLFRAIIKPQNYDVMRIVLGAYMNGEIN